MPLHFGRRKLGGSGTLCKLSGRVPASFLRLYSADIALSRANYFLERETKWQHQTKQRTLVSIDKNSEQTNQKTREREQPTMRSNVTHVFCVVQAFEVVLPCFQAVPGVRGVRYALRKSLPKRKTARCLAFQAVRRHGATLLLDQGVLSRRGASCDRQQSANAAQHSSNERHRTTRREDRGKDKGQTNKSTHATTQPRSHAATQPSQTRGKTKTRTKNQHERFSAHENIGPSLHCRSHAPFFVRHESPACLMRRAFPTKRIGRRMSSRHNTPQHTTTHQGRHTP
mgnify:CR=1 FL=1